MSTKFSSLSLQEAAIQYAKSMALNINAAAAEVAGVEVMWFRAKPDKRSQDVIFQSYTLYGVEDCPLRFKAMYSDTGYDDAAITYNIMGLEYAIPLTLEIALKTWTTATEEDGSLPQRGDVVFIPLSNKLVEVVSMTPVKAIGAQITSYKVNCSIYKPTRSRLVGENLKESIAANTENLYSRFGEDIKNVIDNVVDDKQLSMFNSTSKDKYKEVKAEPAPDSLCPLCCCGGRGASLCCIYDSVGTVTRRSTGYDGRRTGLAHLREDQHSRHFRRHGKRRQVPQGR